MSIPSNETELVNNIVNLYNNKLMSIDSAIEHSPYVNDIETEIKAIQTGQEVSKEDNQGTTVNKGTTTEKGTTSEDKENNI